MPSLHTTIKNERTKLSANFLNTVAAGLIALSILGPLFDSARKPLNAGLGMGIALHFIACFLLSQLEED